MGTRENKVETYLDDEVKRVFGGETRKWVSPGRDGVPDRILFIEDIPAIFVEVKTTDGKLSSVQKREHHRLKGTRTKSMITTVYGSEGVDTLMTDISVMLDKQQILGRMHRKGQPKSVVTTHV